MTREPSEREKALRERVDSLMPLRYNVRLVLSRMDVRFEPNNECGEICHADDVRSALWKALTDGAPAAPPLMAAVKLLVDLDDLCANGGAEAMALDVDFELCERAGKVVDAYRSAAAPEAPKEDGLPCGCRLEFSLVGQVRPAVAYCLTHSLPPKSGEVR